MASASLAASGSIVVAVVIVVVVVVVRGRLLRGLGVWLPWPLVRPCWGRDLTVKNRSRNDADHRRLSGRTVALPETRELDRLAQLLEAEGAATLRCPLVAIKDAPDQAPVEAWLRALVADGVDDLVLLTGEGLRRLLAAAERIGIRADVIAAHRAGPHDNARAETGARAARRRAVVVAAGSGADVAPG